MSLPQISDYIIYDFLLNNSKKKKKKQKRIVTMKFTKCNNLKDFDVNFEINSAIVYDSKWLYVAIDKDCRYMSEIRSLNGNCC